MTKTQEATVGCLVAILPLLLANWTVWKCPLAQQHPFPYAYGSVDDYKRDYRLGFGLVVSEDPEKLLQPEIEPKTIYERAVASIWRRQLRFLSWYYAFSFIEGLLFGFIASEYGNLWGRYTIYDWLARKIFLPQISEWQLLLTDFAFPKNPKREVQADVLCDGILYRGKVGDYFLDTNGKLSGLYMKDAERFRRKDFETACDKANGAKVNQDAFWRKIPGANFYIPADKISNLNVRFPPHDEDFKVFIKELLSKFDVPSGTTATFEDSKQSTSQSAPANTNNDPNSSPLDPSEGEKLPD